MNGLTGRVLSKLHALRSSHYFSFYLVAPSAAPKEFVGAEREAYVHMLPAVLCSLPCLA